MSNSRSGFWGTVVLTISLAVVCGCAKKQEPTPAASKTAVETTKQGEAKAAEGAGQKQGEPVFNAGDIMAGVDKNGDGKVTRAEYDAIWKDKAVAERNFKTIDRNGDGVLTAEEFNPKLSTK